MVDYYLTRSGEVIWYDNGMSRTLRDVVSVPNKPFYDELEYVTYSRGRSSIKFIFNSKHLNQRVEMFVSDMDSLLREGLELKGYWQFVKRGANYGIKKCYPAEPKT